jgi:hypothetical protein
MLVGNRFALQAGVIYLYEMLRVPKAESSSASVSSVERAHTPVGFFLWYRRCKRSFNRVANQPALAVLTAGLFSFLVNGTMGLFLGVPPPAVHDEYSYWLAADTFAHGRLANPPHSLWVYFETMHVLQQPTYASKYPPGQGLMMAVGLVLFGQPIVGVWLSSALACAAIGWMLRAWICPRWALLGSLLASLHPLMLDWSHHYWGGSVALLGGTLVLGAMRRICLSIKPEANQKPETGSRPFSRFSLLTSGFLLGLGMAALANSRPYEGMIVSLLALGTIVVAVIRSIRAGSVRVRNIIAPICWQVLPSTGLVLVLTATAMAFYNWKVTGNALRLPYVAYQEIYGVAPAFLWGHPRPIPEYRHKEIRDLWLTFELPIYEGQKGLAGALEGAWWKTRVFYGAALPSPLILLSLIALPWVLLRSFWSRVAVLYLLLFFVALLPVVGAIGHYAAPVGGLLIYLIVESLRQLRVWRWSGQRIGPWIVRAMLIGWCLWLIPKGIAMSQFDTADVWRKQAMERAAFLNRLTHEPGQHLVIVHYSPDHSVHAEWVYNEADIDNAKVIFAREMKNNEPLLDYFHDRHIWLVDADETLARLTPYPGVSTKRP